MQISTPKAAVVSTTSKAMLDASSTSLLATPLTATDFGTMTRCHNAKLLSQPGGNGTVSTHSASPLLRGEVFT